ncbi:MAG: hypothetical protein HW400_528 [Candidatus Levybacteria bacterium]|nr:hypothetical protein [Candidatus Levybacteria bacterium]
MKTVKSAWIFDVDGVITNPREKKVTEPEILDEIIKRLEKSELVALNTGRSISWVKDRVLNQLIEKIKDKKILNNLLVVGEKGGTWIDFDENGNLTENKDNDISVPDNLKNEIRNLISNKYSESMFYDESKLTMISTEMKDGYSLEDYREKQKVIYTEFKKMLNNESLSDKFKIDPTTIATDIENIFVGKHFAIKRILKWVKSKGVEPQKYIALGDSFGSDIPMAEELNLQGLPVEFIYVGKENIDVSKHPFPIKITQNKFEKGTLEFLKSHQP